MSAPQTTASASLVADPYIDNVTCFRLMLACTQHIAPMNVNSYELASPYRGRFAVLVQVGTYVDIRQLARTAEQLPTLATASSLLSGLHCPCGSSQAKPEARATSAQPAEGRTTRLSSSVFQGRVLFISLRSSASVSTRLYYQLSIDPLLRSG